MIATAFWKSYFKIGVFIGFGAWVPRSEAADEGRCVCLCELERLETLWRAFASVSKVS